MSHRLWGKEVWAGLGSREILETGGCRECLLVSLQSLVTSIAALSFSFYSLVVPCFFVSLVEQGPSPNETLQNVHLSPGLLMLKAVTYLWVSVAYFQIQSDSWPRLGQVAEVWKGSVINTPLHCLSYGYLKNKKRVRRWRTKKWPLLWIKVLPEDEALVQGRGDMHSGCVWVQRARPPPRTPPTNPRQWLCALCLVQKAGKICMLTGAKVKEKGGWFHGPEGSRCFTMIILFPFYLIVAHKLIFTLT